MADNIKLVIVGSIGIDDIATVNEQRKNLLGGSASYACAASSFYTPTGMVGIIGSDFPDEHKALYHHFGIDLSGLQIAAGNTFRWSGVYDADMINRQTLKTDLGVFADFMPKLPPAYRNVEHVLLGNIRPELQLHVLDQIENVKFVALDTMDLWIKTAPDALRMVVNRSNLLFLNDAEARLFTGRYNIRDCADALLDMGPQYVVIKKGEHGAMLFARDLILIIPAYPVKQLADPTGAGDMFAGACMGFLSACGCDKINPRILRTALLHGSVTASFGVESFSLDRLIEVNDLMLCERVNELNNMINA